MQMEINNTRFQTTLYNGLPNLGWMYSQTKETGLVHSSHHIFIHIQLARSKIKAQHAKTVLKLGGSQGNA